MSRTPIEKSLVDEGVVDYYNDTHGTDIKDAVGLFMHIYETEKSIERTCDKLGISKCGGCAMLKRHGIKLNLPWHLRTRLHPGDVWLIRRLLAAGVVQQKTIGRMFKLSEPSVSSIKHGRVWK